jgi:DNA modification methylase
LGTFKSIVERNAAGVESLKSVIKKKPLFSIFDDARLLHNNVGAKSVDLIITSPPYVGAQKYIRSSSLSLGWLDLAYNGHLRPLERLTIGREHFGRDEIEDETITGVKDADKLLRQVRKNNPLRAHIASTYLVEIHSSLLAMHRILKCGGQLIMITGPNTICGNNFDTPTFVEELAHRAGFVTQFKLMDHIRSRGLMTKRNKTAGMITSEVVLGLAKP